MTAFRISIPGIFEDAFVYMGHVFAVTGDNSLISLNLEECLASRFDDDVPRALDFYMLRNDWLPEAAGIPSFASIPEVFNALTLAADDLGTIEIDGPWESRSDQVENKVGGRVLDLQVYGKRLYISATQGLYDLDFDFIPEEISYGPLRKRTDARCLSTSSKYATVVASCGDDGLLVGFNEFHNFSSATQAAEMTLVADKSQRASWLSYCVANYQNDRNLDFFSGHKESRGRQSSDDLVSEFSRDKHSSDILQGETRDADFIFNSNGLFLSQKQSQGYDLFSVHQRRGKLVGAPRYVGEGPLDEALSAHVFKDAVVVESFDGVFLISATEHEELHTGQALKVRTFPASNRSKNLITVIDEDALHIISPIRAGSNQSETNGPPRQNRYSSKKVIDLDQPGLF